MPKLKKRISPYRSRSRLSDLLAESRSDAAQRIGARSYVGPTARYPNPYRKPKRRGMPVAPKGRLPVYRV